MTDKEIYQQIEEYKEAESAHYKKIHEQVEASIVKHAQAKKRRKKLFVGVMSIAAVLIVTLAIVLPIVLQPQDDEVRYSDDSVLILDKLDYNLKEYNSRNNLSLLYLNWYEYAEDLATARYYEEGKEKETVYLYEKFIDGNTGYGVKLSVMKRNIIVESLDAMFGELQVAKCGDVEIAYTLKKTLCIAKFEYQGYKYYLEINDEITLDFLAETIESMFHN